MSITVCPEIIGKEIGIPGQTLIKIKICKYFLQPVPVTAIALVVSRYMLTRVKW